MTGSHSENGGAADDRSWTRVGNSYIEVWGVDSLVEVISVGSSTQPCIVSGQWSALSEEKSYSVIKARKGADLSVAWRGIGQCKSKLPASWGSFQCWTVAGRFQWASSSRGHPWVLVSLPTYSTARWKQFTSPSSLSFTPVMVSPFLSLSSLSKPWGREEGTRSTQQSSMVQSCWQPSSTPSPWLLIIC